MKTDPPIQRRSSRARAQSSIQFLCPRCEEMFLCPADPLLASGGALSCPHCRLALHGLSRGEGGSSPAAEAVERCWVCGNEELYIQKDFNRELGFMIVLGSAMIIFLVMLLIDHVFGIFCLLGIAVVDWIAYRLLANVTVCYLCQTIYRGFPQNPEHHGFYLGNEEKYKKRRQEWLKTLLGNAS